MGEEGKGKKKCTLNLTTRSEVHASVQNNLFSVLTYILNCKEEPGEGGEFVNA